MNKEIAIYGLVTLGAVIVGNVITNKWIMPMLGVKSSTPLIDVKAQVKK